MRPRRCLPVWVFATLVTLPSLAWSQPVPSRQRDPSPVDMTARPIAASVLPSSVGSIPRQAVPDPVGNGIGYGALIGAAAGAGLMAVLYAQCDGSCDAPARGPICGGHVRRCRCGSPRGMARGSRPI